MRIVIDTNVIVSGVFFGGLPKKLLDVVADKEIVATTSDEIIAEYHETYDYLLNTKKYVPQKNVSIDNVIGNMKIIQPKSNFKISRDPDDDKFINCAFDGKCKYIVSGDSDLLELRSFKDVEIVTVRDFMDEYYGN